MKITSMLFPLMMCGLLYGLYGTYSHYRVVVCMDDKFITYIGNTQDRPLSNLGVCRIRDLSRAEYKRVLFLIRGGRLSVYKIDEGIPTIPQKEEH